jgi:hypothetical protein
LTAPFSISSASPGSSGCAINVNLFLRALILNERENRSKKITYCLFGVSAKHFSEEVSTTVSQNVTTGSDT